MARLLRSALALEDLDAIWLEIAQHQPKVADSWIDMLHETACRLAEMPELGRLRPEISPEGVPIRSLAVKPYVLFYCPIEGGVCIVRVLHGSRDLNAKVFEG